MNNYIAYLITTVLVFLTVGTAAHVVFSKKISSAKCAIVWSVNLAAALLLMYLGLRFFENTTHRDMIFLAACLTMTATAHFCYRDALAAKVMFITALYLSEGIISLSLYLLMPDGFGFFSSILTQVIAASVLVFAVKYREKLNFAVGTIPSGTLLPFIAYAMFALIILQFYRRRIIALDLFLAYFIVLLSVIIFIFMTLALYQSAIGSIAKNERELLKTLEEAERRNYRLLLSSVENLKIANHDSRHHIRTVKGLLQHDKKDEALKYLLSLEKDVQKNTIPTVCLNITADAIIKYYAELCHAGDIDFEHHFTINADLNISDIDLCSCLSNCLENAVIATLMLDGNRKIRAVAFERQNNLIIKVENSCKNAAADYKEGVGTASLKRIAAKYNGTYTVELGESSFAACVVLSNE